MRPGENAQFDSQVFYFPVLLVHACTSGDSLLFGFFRNDGSLIPQPLQASLIRFLFLQRLSQPLSQLFYFGQAGGQSKVRNLLLSPVRLALGIVESQLCG